MPIRKYSPVTPGLRKRVSITRDELTVSEPHKPLTVGKKQSGGRNAEGHRTVRNRGGGHKRLYRIVDFKREKDGIPANVLTIEYDPNRTAFIALVEYTDGEKRYIIAPQGLKVGMTIESGKNVPVEVGNAMFLSEVPVGTNIFCIELKPGKGAALVRSAGTMALMAGREGNYVIVKLPSGETRKVLGTCKAVVGSASNPDHNLQVLGKAGRNRWLGRRPRVRGVAMNPVDHPMGGGEGRASGGHPRDRKGFFSKGKKTRSTRKYSDKHIISRSKTKKK